MSAKAVPLRMCVVCRRRLPKAELLRHVRRPASSEAEAGQDGGAWMADAAQLARGRGCYLCSDPQCQDKFSRMGRERRKRKGVEQHG